MSRLTRSFLFFLIALKAKDQESVTKAAAQLMDRFVKDKPVPGDTTDQAIREIIEKTDVDEAYGYLAELIAP